MATAAEIEAQLRLDTANGVPVLENGVAFTVQVGSAQYEEFIQGAVASSLARQQRREKADAIKGERTQAAQALAALQADLETLTTGSPDAAALRGILTRVVRVEIHLIRGLLNLSPTP